MVSYGAAALGHPNRGSQYYVAHLSRPGRKVSPNPQIEKFTRNPKSKSTPHHSRRSEGGNRWFSCSRLVEFSDLFYRNGFNYKGRGKSAMTPPPRVLSIVRDLNDVLKDLLGRARQAINHPSAKRRIASDELAKWIIDKGST